MYLAVQNPQGRWQAPKQICIDEVNILLLAKRSPSLLMAEGSPSLNLPVQDRVKEALPPLNDHKRSIVVQSRFLSFIQ